MQERIKRDSAPVREQDSVSRPCAGKDLPAPPRHQVTK